MVGGDEAASVYDWLHGVASSMDRSREWSDMLALFGGDGDYLPFQEDQTYSDLVGLYEHVRIAPVF